jgi:hypothetical protein
VFLINSSATDGIAVCNPTSHITQVIRFGMINSGFDVQQQEKVKRY